MWRPWDRDLIRTVEGLYFTVYGYDHPPGGAACFLQYVPRPGRPGRGLKPMDYPHGGAVVETTAWLARHHPVYVAPGRGSPLPVVPEERVEAYFSPCAGLAAIRQRGPRDALEEEVLAFTDLLSRVAGIPPERLGITGSVLLGVHDPATSDMDVVICGGDMARRARDAILAGAVPDVTPVPPDHAARWLRLMTAHHPHTPAEARYLIGRRWHYGYWRGREFSLKTVRDPAVRDPAGAPPGAACGPRAAPSGGGRPPARALGRVRVRGTVASADEACYTPAVYTLADVTWPDGSAGAAGPVPELPVWSFEALYSWAFDPGQRVEAVGLLEEAGGDLRLLVGTAAGAGSECMRVIG